MNDLINVTQNDKLPYIIQTHRRPRLVPSRLLKPDENRLVLMRRYRMA